MKFEIQTSTAAPAFLRPARRDTSPRLAITNVKATFHHLIHDFTHRTAINMAPPRVKKALNKPPADATRSHDAYPGEHLGRKRAADFFQGDEADPEAELKGSGEPKSKALKTANASDKTKPSKVDGHPVETEKAHPGGDVVEVEPRKKGRPRKIKESAAEQGAPPESAKRRRGKPKIGDVKKSDAGDRDMSDMQGDEDEEPEATLSPKSKRSGKGHAKNISSAESTKPKAKATKPKKDVPRGKHPALKATDDTSEQKPGKKPTSRKATDAAETPDKAASATSKNNKKVELLAEKDKSEDEDFSAPEDLAVNENVFDSLLSIDNGKQSVDEGPLQSGNSSSAKASKKATKSQNKAGMTSKDDAKSSKKGKELGKVADEEKGLGSKSKKRKAPPIHDVDAIKADVLDPLTQLPSANKKPKKSKSRSNALEAAGDSLGSLISSVNKNVKAAIDIAGSVAGGGQTPVMGDVEGVAEGVLKEKKSNKKGGKGIEEEVSSEESLLKGLESSGDEKDPDEDEGFDQGQLPPPLPESTFDKINAISQPATASEAEGGVVYVGRIPHGFYEHEMRAYFSQFGSISRLRLSRNKTTGASRHYAFIEFVSNEVAKIVEETMNNYLLFGHILKVKVVNPNRLHPNIWKGANRRFKRVPWPQMEGRKLAMPMSREQWEKRVEGEQKRRKDKAEKMKDIGYEFDAPLKGVDQVHVKESRKVTEGGEPMVEQEKTLITEPGEEGSSMMIKETVVTKKVRKPSAKAKEIMNSREATAGISKKGKRKAEDVVGMAKERIDAAEPTSKKTKKAKAEAGQVVDEVTNTAQDASASTVDRAMRAGDETAEKAKLSLEEAAPIAKDARESVEKATKTTQDVVAPVIKKSKKSVQEAGDDVKGHTTQIAKKGKEAAGKASEATMEATGRPKKAKKTKA